MSMCNHFLNTMRMKNFNGTLVVTTQGLIVPIDWVVNRNA